MSDPQDWEDDDWTKAVFEHWEGKTAVPTEQPKQDPKPATAAQPKPDPRPSVVELPKKSHVANLKDDRSIPF